MRKCHGEKWTQLRLTNGVTNNRRKSHGPQFENHMIEQRGEHNLSEETRRANLSCAQWKRMKQQQHQEQQEQRWITNTVENLRYRSRDVQGGRQASNERFSCEGEKTTRNLNENCGLSSHLPWVAASTVQPLSSVDTVGREERIVWNRRCKLSSNISIHTSQIKC